MVNSSHPVYKLLGRYHVDDVIQEAREDCYLATLRIKDADVTDSRSYYLAVENDRGIDRHVVQLYVNEPLDVGTLVSLGAVGLAISVLMVCGCVYAIRTERWCFARKGDFKPADMNGDKKDIEKISTGPGGIPADAIYTTASRGGRHNSPETMKQPSFTFHGRHNLEGHRKDNICLGFDSNVHHYQVRTLVPNYHKSNNARKGFYRTAMPNKRSSNFSLYTNGNNLLGNRIDFEDVNKSFLDIERYSHTRSFEDVNKSFLDIERYSHTRRYKNGERPRPLQPANQNFGYHRLFPQ
ncbi:hypothetical protein QE152_g3534 [Popillia japonica]|uniref:Uncharacterized protein n=1 Tax=Popillia japonica TaxID=7064 RepID=A0AAW1N0M6_POPJA